MAKKHENSNVWPLIEAQRHAVADLLDGLTDDQWATPNTCGAWTVREVAAHLTMGWNVSMPKFMLGMIRHRGFDNFNLAAGKKLAERPAAEIVADLRANAAHRFVPPGAGPEAPLTDLVIHGAEMREALGMEPATVSDATSVVLDGLAVPQKGAPFPLKDASGLQFAATDHAWTSGSGARVEGPSHQLMLALSGRLDAIDQLSGDGVELLRERSR